MSSALDPASQSPWSYSCTGERLTAPCGILELMEDTGRALTQQPNMRMLGGGNPAAVPAMQAIFRRRWEQIMADGPALERMLGVYDPPRGNPFFLQALARLLRETYGWAVGPEHLVITNGGQTAFFCLFNLLCGENQQGVRRKVLLPLCPEYIGYADQGLEPDLFVSCPGKMTWPQGEAAREFKYEIDFDAVARVLDEEAIGAIAASRPTNPSGNVLTDAEVHRLDQLARHHGVPLILDNAYGTPFPRLMFVDAEPFWSPNTILTLSLSKLGLPGTRTAMVIAPPEIAEAIARMTAVMALSNGTIGQQMALPWIESGEILRFGPEILAPFYAARSRQAESWARESFDAAGVDWAMHRSDGALFHWLWFRRLSIPTQELYQRLKQREVLIIPGEYFFFGNASRAIEQQQCIRLNYSGPPETVRDGLRIIADEVAKWQA